MRTPSPVARNADFRAIMGREESTGVYHSSVHRRMRLKRVRLFGFKTFADRTEFSLEGGLIAVVGPNGCGKSNLVDAILWGLGEGNARQLRAANSQDVIFSGSAKRKPLGFAEVSLIFDNEDGALPIETPEVQITRRLTRSGDSEYSINRRSCRLRDIYELLADSGLGRAGYAIVGQKEIDTAVSASAEDRRAWVDEAAGVQRYRARKTESLRRLESTQEHLARVDDILRELTSQRDPLRDEAEIAARYKNLLSTLREVELGLLVNEVTSSVRDVRALEAKIEESLRLSRNELARADALDTQTKTLGRAISSLEQEMDSVRALQQGSLTSLERAEANLRLAQQRLESLDDVEKSLQEDAGGAEARIVEAVEEVRKLREEESAERTGLDSLRHEFAGAGAEAKRLGEELRALEGQLSRARDAHGKRLRAEAEQAHRTERLQLVERELSGIRASTLEIDEAVAEAKAAFDEVSAKLQRAQDEVRGIESKVADNRKEEETDAQSVRRALAERASLEGRRRGIESTIEAYEGLTQGARAVVEAAERGVLKAQYIPVGQAIEADKELALAIETALGASANDLIVEHQSDAKEAIDWLKANRAGRATFQPIPLMRSSEPSYDLRRLLNERGVIDRASELVRCDPKVRPVIDSLLGCVVIVKDLEVALRHAKTNGWGRLVTTEGEVVHSGGAVTGGQGSRQAYGLVQRKADLVELNKELTNLEKVVGQFDARAAKRKQDKDALESDLAGAKQRLSGLQSEVQEARSFLQTLLDEAKSTQRTKEKLAHEIEGLSKPVEVPEIPGDIGALEAARDVLLKAVAAKSSDAEGAELRLRESQARLEQAKYRLQAGERRLNVAREAESAREKKLEHLEPDRERLRLEIDRHSQDKAKAAINKSDADERLARHTNERRSLLEQSLKLTEEAKRARENASSIGDGAHQAEVNRARAEARRANALTRLSEDYGLNEEDALEQEGRHEVPADANTVVNRLRREIKAMGDVNVGAIEAYDRLTHRIDELTAQRDDILGGLEQILASVAELDKLTRDRFVSTFEAVQAAFSLMFEKLFGGGSGHISLSDPARVLESGIDLDVTLPGKKKQPLNLLSGGERSLCATAFLLALLTVKPSPLVVLDEVDAPLDGRNVERFAEALVEFGERTQFVVITHNHTTITAASVMVGVVMQEPGVSVLLPQRLPTAVAPS